MSDKKNIKEKVPSLYLKNLKENLNIIASNFYKNPSLKIKITGITGTKGKTTTSYLLEQAIKHFKGKPSVIGTINYRSHKRIISNASNTTPLPLTFNQLLYEFIKDGSNYCFSEISSHALSLKRVENIHFDNVIFTNFQSDHLDFHKTRKNYLNAKLKIFKLLLLSKKKNKFAVLNSDDESFDKILKVIKNKIKYFSYGINKNATVQAFDIKVFPDYSLFKIKLNKNIYSLKTQLIGKHNIYNILSILTFLYALGFDIKKIIEVISKLKNVPGRLEKISSSKNFSIYIDYAHTANSLENVLKTLNGLPHKRILCLFGCGGDRDKTKRSPMGKIACSLSNKVIITSDNPRNENPISIINDIEKDIKGKFSNYKKIIDREKAIIEIIKEAKENDLILIAGKGHENYQIIKDKKINFDDKKEVLNALKNLRKI